MERSFGTKLLRTIFMGLDSIIYHFVSFLLQVIFDIADIPADTFQVIFDDIISRVYLILAIFMLFKVTISFLTYLVNPDSIGDKQQGVGKLITRIMLVLVMLLLQPTVFGLLFRAQAPILRTIPKVILGSTTYSEDGTRNNLAYGNGIEESGTEIAWTVLKTFYSKNPDCYGGSDYIAVDGFYEAEGSVHKDPITLAYNHVNDHCEPKDDGGIYAYEYKMFISSIAGGFLCYCLLGIGITVAIRMFKLIILQAIAPIPIMSYVDPKSSKDGAFSQWTKAIVSTWLELFINMAIVYLIIHLVSILIVGDGGTGFTTYLQNLEGGNRKAFFLLFIILGLFAFARQAPKFIMDILGIKGSGSFGRVMGMSAALVRAPGTMVNEVRENFVARQAGGFVSGNRVGRVLDGIADIGVGLFTGLGTTGMAIGDGFNADRNVRQATLNHLDRRRQDLVGHDRRMATVMKEYEDFITDRFQKKGADIIISEVSGSYGTIRDVTLNELDQAQRAAAAAGRATFIVGHGDNAVELRTFGSEVETIRGDLIDAGTELWAMGSATERVVENGRTIRRTNAGPSVEERQAITDYHQSIRETGGRTRTGTVTRGLLGGPVLGNEPYRSRRKPTDRHVNIQNNTRQNRQQ